MDLDRPAFPIVQISLDLTSLDEALETAAIAVDAGVDWLEAGTPLIVSQGVAAIGALARAFPAYPVLADYKAMDSGGKHVERTVAQGGSLLDPSITESVLDWMRHLGPQGANDPLAGLSLT